MSTTSDIGSKIKRLREGSNISQAQIATYLGIDQSMVSKIENGERNPSIELIDKLSILFGCSIDSIDAKEECNTSLEFAFRASNINNDDLEAIASINRIALNLREMKNILRGASN